MILVPAIDIRGGRAVRLVRGDFGRETVYRGDALEAAREWARAGARRLHVVDLDGARSGHPANLDCLARVAREVDVEIQYGGGLRSVEAAAAALAAGADRVILGTAALSDDAFLEGCLERFGERVIVAIDARAGEVLVAGWTAGTGTAADAVAARLAERRVERFLCTAVDRDGTLEGPDLKLLGDLAGAVGARATLTYSGGVGALEHLSALARLAPPRLEAVICGKALYEGRFTLAAGQAALDRTPTARDRAGA